MEKRTLVLGASPNPERFSYKAVKSLEKRNIPVVAVGLRDAAIGDVRIIKGIPEDPGPVHTIGLYMNAKNQEAYYQSILKLKPERIIFNPGTWNPDLASIARENGIEVVDDCMLAMLNCGHY